METRSSQHLATDLACPCGAPRPALRLALIAAIVTLLAGLLVAGVRMAGAASAGSRVGGNALVPACAQLPVVAEHRYRMAGKVRPLLFFWIGRDNVGEARMVWRRGEDGAKGFEMLIGSDPARAPRKINRWGYVAEEVDGPQACVVGVMKQSNEESLEEAKKNVEKEAKEGGFVYKAIRGVASADEARAGVTTVRVEKDLTFHDLDFVLDATSTESKATSLKSVPLPPKTRPGFLVALAELIHGNVEAYRQGARPGGSHKAGPITYVFNGGFHELTLRHSELIRDWHDGKRTASNVVRAEFELRSRKGGDKSNFELTYGTDGPLAEIPLHASYRPRWWLQVDLALDDSDTSS